MGYKLIYAVDCALWIELLSPSPARLTNEVCSRDVFPEKFASPCKLFNLLLFDIDSNFWVNFANKLTRSRFSAVRKWSLPNSDRAILSILNSFSFSSSFVDISTHWYDSHYGKLAEKVRRVLTKPSKVIGLPVLVKYELLRTAVKLFYMAW